MKDEELERRLHALRGTWRVPREDEMPLDDMWPVIEARAFSTTARRFPARWVRTWLPMAAMLLVGIGVGQVAPPMLTKAGRIPVPVVGQDGEPTARPASTDQAFVGVASDYLERVTALLVTLADESRSGRPGEFSVGPARDLLATTRLLMDRPQDLDPHMVQLLDDLELVLAQVVRLPARPNAPDVYLIDQALDQREVLPRLRVFLAENTTWQP